ncbi:MAG: hypothetical protein A3D31_02270 [Candidatus Fluviicola riflensis]|nr:MAG: hypothetical protein CHH17_12770 [Candidatus Fluviicola riflensis]OGS78820.1 MAG: hypothetical protein A3D31_02270 [Candidatus Fluviicola riflensis]OGS85842.1 MAG: hypothetical protein A3E30_09755 [Fluviicola sp. RIFCSPHIGHO2_12_FULL_43_24]OGS86251.1 MAG: hypothetical protein A2724_01725 [Fluviicola sp. RIFCSPHIGHO2_01_FULL_43_53]
MAAIYEAYAIYAECTGDDLGTKEMEEGMPNRVFNKVEAFSGNAIDIPESSKGERIRLQRGIYRVNGLSFLTMLSAGVPPVPPVPTEHLVDIYPGYCILYDANNPPKGLDDMKGVFCVGSMGTAYDGTPSIFECVIEVKDKPMEISLGHQCSYKDYSKEPGYDPATANPKAYLRLGGSDYHVCARISIFKIG